MHQLVSEAPLPVEMVDGIKFSEARMHSSYHLLGLKVNDIQSSSGNVGHARDAPVLW
jgi:hypothetical protein